MKLSLLEVDKVRELIKFLETCLQTGFELSTSSPIDILLDALIDLSLLLKISYKEGGKERKKTPGLKFSERFQDPLGNPRQTKIHFESQIAWDPQAAEFFAALGSLGVRLKNGDSFKGAFMALIKGFPEFLTTPPKKSSEPEEIQKDRTKPGMKQTRRKYYYRRCR